jgi:mannose/fructose/N-acetylgalactosamine-specific phosphotransferase system component IID
MSFMENATESGVLEKFTVAAKMLGATVVGSMIATMISFTTTITLNMGNYQTLSLQSVFDQIMPKFLSMVLAVSCFMFIRKGKKTTTVMLILFLLGFIIAFLEGLPVFAPAA